jgi:ribosomal protein S7
MEGRIMMTINKLKSLMIISLAVGGIQISYATEVKAPEQVHTALRILASVYADMDAKLKNQQFDRLPHENQEFQDGSQAMRDAIADEPVHFKAKVEASLKKTLDTAQHVADASKSHDAIQVTSAIDALAASMRTLNGLFPEALRAEPGSVPAPQHGGPTAP